ncbi:CST complex subunit ctc1 [Branchiostoma belcheri]|nr:CST complex subunit ctc1 [Branchiostoma belcheri]
MDELLAAVEECTGRKISDVEKDWLRDLYHHVEKNVSSSGDISSSEVTLAVVDQVLSTTPGKELPLSFSFISVEQLVQSQHQACCSHLSTVNQREGTNISTIDTPVRPLDHIRALLLGRLTSGPNSLSVGRNNRAGQLYVEDNTGVVLCEARNKGYLELTAPPCRLIKTCKVKEQDSVVLVPVAATILKNRKGKATKVISIQGRVSELSTILRVKEVVFFMFKLSCPAEQQHIPVIIKGPKLIHLYHLLEPRRDYIITGLKPTTLFKGSADSRNVYCSTAGTQVLPQSTEPQTVACLLGTITACVNSDVGIYQLDGKVRLHLGYQLHVSEGRGLRVGACVAVYNAHLVKEHTQGDAVCLSCCTASCVVIQSFSTLNSPYKPPSSHSAALKHLIYHLNPNLYELCSLLTAVRQLRLKFSSPIISAED